MSAHSRTPSSDDVRSRINSSLFSRRAPDGSPEETLITFVKVYENESDGSSKTRYLILSVNRVGKVVIHKAKRNSNLSFSKGKTWNLDDVRVLEVISPVEFALTMTSRRYIWATERGKDQSGFLTTLARVFRSYTNGRLPELINFNPPAHVPQAPSTSQASDGPQGSPYQQQYPIYPSSAGSESSSALPVTRGSNDLIPPPMLGKTQRAGSFSSVHSSQTQGSSYPVTAPSESSRGRPSMDDDRLPPNSASSASYSRPLLTDNGLRPSPVEARAPSPRVVPSSGIGMGPPPVQRKMSEDRAERLVPSNLRNVSAASEYGPGLTESSRMKKTDSDLGRVDEGQQRPPSRSEKRERERGAPSTNEIPAIRAPGSLSNPIPSSVKSSENPTAKQLAPPKITTTDLTVPSGPLSSTSITSPSGLSRPARRASFNPPPLDTTISREVLLQSRTGILPGAAGMTIAGPEGDDAVLKNVEEMLEGFDWGLGTGGLGVGIDGRKKGSDAIEGRLLDELAALDSANIHAFLESDDRTALVLGHIDEALMDLEDMDLQLTGYRMQLNAVSDDIAYIESQGRWS